MDDEKTVEQRLEEQRAQLERRCMQRAAFVAGFNPRIGFRRSRTLMEGDDCCDHFYYDLEG